MAIIQISKIQVRRGLEENLPQLAAGEFGWSTDTRKLYIGNGVTGSPDYAPIPGNTEILTEISSESQAYEFTKINANIANLQANVTSINSSLANLSSQSETLLDNAVLQTNTSITIQTLTSRMLDYQILRNANTRVGTLTITNVAGEATFDDTFSEVGVTGIDFGVKTFGTTVKLVYTSTNTSTNATFSYYLKSF